ncbi:hypothetical protein BCR33DRAFT_773781 [Rhizoclosmatium globosum]|uniref:Uncharacterized protein n=1 Tax=Rhizoclosmatium globosum TaxID=329046 RepID=A0A1Y2AX00_9FUNG|nr:hypothetical protein BCR33DRAFT_773781 [Rhizoclosmatium globosum]|eukprot:ORY26435.1 hypothetical protein BCR33DRAFT_773781 [Rhizoclosmatium globosum]
MLVADQSFTLSCGDVKSGEASIANDGTCSFAIDFNNCPTTIKLTTSASANTLQAEMTFNLVITGQASTPITTSTQTETGVASIDKVQYLIDDKDATKSKADVTLKVSNGLANMVYFRAAIPSIDAGSTAIPIGNSFTVHGLDCSPNKNIDINVFSCLQTIKPSDAASGVTGCTIQKSSTVTLTSGAVQGCNVETGSATLTRSTFSVDNTDATKAMADVEIGLQNTLAGMKYFRTAISGVDSGTDAIPFNNGANTFTIHGLSCVKGIDTTVTINVFSCAQTASTFVPNSSNCTPQKVSSLTITSSDVAGCSLPQNLAVTLDNGLDLEDIPLDTTVVFKLGDLNTSPKVYVTGITITNGPDTVTLPASCYGDANGPNKGNLSPVDHGDKISLYTGSNPLFLPPSSCSANAPLSIFSASEDKYEVTIYYNKATRRRGPSDYKTVIGFRINSGFIVSLSGILAFGFLFVL